MALPEGAVQRTIQTVTETAATETVLYRTLVEIANDGGVFPNYPIRCKYATTTFEVDSEGNKVHIVEDGMNPHEFMLSQEEMYPLYMTPVTVDFGGTPTNVALGELICYLIDSIIKDRKLDSIIKAHPASQEVLQDGIAFLSIRLNTAELVRVDYTIAWYKDGVLMPDVTTAEIEVIVSATSEFQAWVTTPFGVTKSEIATLTVVAE